MVLMMSQYWLVLCLYCWFSMWQVSGQEAEKALDPSTCNLKLDLLIILDSSGSVGKHIWPQEVDFAKLVVKQLDIGPDLTHVGIIDFSRSSIVRIDINTPDGASSVKIQQTLDVLKTQFQAGVTYMDMAFNTAIKMYKEVPASRKVPKLLVIVTDGKATKRNGQTGFQLMQAPVTELKALGVNMIAIGVGKNVNLKELQFIASYRGNVILVSTFKALVTDITRILSTLCSAPPQLKSSCPIDLVVVLDCSGSIGPWNWKKQLDFVRKLIKSFTISPADTRIGLIVFHETVKVYINITKDGWNENYINSVLSNIATLWAPYMRTYTDLALNTAVQMVDECKRNFPKTVVLVTDGETSFWRKPLLKKPVQLLESNGVDVFSVGIGPMVNHEELLYISKNLEKIFVIKNFKLLIKELTSIAKKLCESK